MTKSLIQSVVSVLRRGVLQLRRLVRARWDSRIRLSAMEFFLTDTCNLRCADCTASSPFLSDANLPNLAGFRESLGFLSPAVRCDEIRFVGGEPLLNKEICGFMRAARESGIFRRIRVITNGLLLNKTSDEFWQLADIVRVSVYPSTGDMLTPEKLDAFRAAASNGGTKLEIVRDTHFMEAFRDTREDDAQEVLRVFSECGEAHQWSCHLLYGNHLFRCSRVHTLDRYLGKTGVRHDSFAEEDGILLDRRASLLRELRGYLGATEPLKACSYCRGTSGPLMEHRQMPVKEIRVRLKHASRTTVSAAASTRQ